MGTKNHPDGTWVYPPIGVTMAMVGLEEIGAYISRRQNKVAQYIETRHIMDLCLAEERNPGMRLYRQWWEHPDLNIMGIRAGQVATEVGGGETGGGELELEGEGE